MAVPLRGVEAGVPHDPLQNELIPGPQGSKGVPKDMGAPRDPCILECLADHPP